MKKISVGLVAVAIAAGIGASAIAADDPIAVRQGLMKNVGASMRVAGGMVKGKIPFDAVAAELAMRAINSSAAGYTAFFPDDSKTGGDTEAAPAIWTDKAGFETVASKLTEASAKAVEAAKQGEAGFKAAFGAVAANCKGCHEKYRIKKN